LKRAHHALVLAALLCGAGCTAPGPAPVVDSSRPRDAAPPPVHSPRGPSLPLEKAAPAVPLRHLVRRGDTLYAIAWRHALDYRDIAAWNRLRPPYVIYAGQQLRLRPSKSPVAPSPPVRARQPARAEKQRIVPAPPLRQSAARKEPIRWGWPAKGKLLKIESLTARSGLRIGGRLGQRVQASADGEVVYSGSGLLGYGKLIIIKHNEKFLSAYGHNSELLVKEGDRVRSGQQIAKMGKAVNGDVMLHFEIRERGKPIDPLKYLPKIST